MLDFPRSAPGVERRGEAPRRRPEQQPEGQSILGESRSLERGGWAPSGTELIPQAEISI